MRLPYCQPPHGVLIADALGEATPVAGVILCAYQFMRAAALERDMVDVASIGGN